MRREKRVEQWGRGDYKMAFKIVVGCELTLTEKRLRGRPAGVSEEEPHPTD